MGGKQGMSSFVAILLALASFNFLPTDGQLVCPWCDKKMQSDLVNCVYIDIISEPRLLKMPLGDIDNIKWKLLSDSDSMLGMPYDQKKVAMDDKFVAAMAGAIKQNDYQSNPEIIGVVSELAGHCYSWVTGYDSTLIIQEIKDQVKDIIEKSSPLVGGNPNTVPKSELPYSANQNPQNSFQPQIQPSYVDDAPSNPPGSTNSFNNPPNVNGAPFQPSGSQPVNSFNNPSNVNYVPFQPPESPPVNSFNNPSNVNGASFQAPGSQPVNSFNTPSNVNGASFQPPGSQPKVRQSNNYWGQRPAGLNNSRNQTSPGGSAGTSLKTDNTTPVNAALVTTASPKMSSPPQNTKSSDLKSSGNSKSTSQIKENGNEKSDDAEPCDEKFKIALYEKLTNDDRFRSVFGKLPISATKPAVPKIMNYVFKKYGIQQHYREFSTFWKFDSKTLNKESKVEDWAELMSKNCKIIFSRNDLLKGNCEEIGKKIADYILGVLPGDPPASSTQTPNPNDGYDNTSTDSNANSAPSSATNATPEHDFNSGNSTNSGNHSFPELHSKLSGILKPDESTKQDSDDVPFSETLSTFEAKQNLEILNRAAKSCLSSAGFDFKKFLSTITKVTDSIQSNHPDWSNEKCKKETYAVVIAVLADLLQKTVKSGSNNPSSQSSSNQPDSDVDSSASQNSNSDASPDIPNDYDSDDSANSGQGTDYVSDSAPQPQPELTNYGDYPDTREPVNQPQYGDQPGPGEWNDGLAQPSNFAPGPVNTDFGNLANRNIQNTPTTGNQANNFNYGSQDYGPSIPQPVPQNLPSQNYGPSVQQPVPSNFPSPDYSAIPPANRNSQPYSGTQPFLGNQNTGFQKSPNLAPDYGFMNSPNGNNQFQPESPGNNNAYQPRADPALSNGNTQNLQPQPYQNHDYIPPSYGPAVPNGNTHPGFNSPSNYNSGFPDY